jgi:uncharacterized delta-60 repeat protein
MKYEMKAILFVSIVLIRVTAVFCQAGNLDSTFDADGKVTQSFFYGTTITPVYAGIQTDGKIIVSGTVYYWYFNFDWFIARYNENGTIDPTFGTQGFVREGYYANASILQPDGKILMSAVSLYGDSYLVRYNSDGTVDQDFFSLPSYTEYGWSALAVRADGKIIVGGSVSEEPTVARYNANGIADSSFGVNGRVITSLDQSIDFTSVSLQTDGKIIAAGCNHFYFASENADFVLVRYLENGIIDSSFGVDGIVTISDSSLVSTSAAVAIQDDGKIILGGSSFLDTSFHSSLTRFNIDGSIDSTFGIKGIADSIVNLTSVSIAFQPDGKIVAGGSTYNLTSPDFALLRYNTNGTTDSTFGTGGLITTNFDGSWDIMTALTMQADGKIVAAGSSGDTYVLARYLSGLNVGIVNFSSAQVSPLIYPNPIEQTEVLEYTLTSDEFISVSLYDVNGKLIKQFFDSEKRTTGSHKETLSMPELMAGNYFLTISNGSQHQTVKMVKQ